MTQSIKLACLSCIDKQPNTGKKDGATTFIVICHLAVIALQTDQMRTVNSLQQDINSFS